LHGGSVARTLTGAQLAFGADIQEPRLAHAQWLLAQMQAARQIVDPTGLEAVLSTIYRPDLYSAAVADI